MRYCLTSSGVRLSGFVAAKAREVLGRGISEADSTSVGEEGRRRLLEMRVVRCDRIEVGMFEVPKGRANRGILQ